MHAPPLITSRTRAPVAAHGFTAIELLVTLAILAVLAALAVPSFTPLIERWRVRQAVEELQSTFYFARSEAIKRGGGITIASGSCASQDQNTNWSSGWIVCNGTELLQQGTPPAKVNVSITKSSATDSTAPIDIDRWGQFPGSFDFRFTPQGKNNTNASAATLCVSGAGRLKRLSSGDGTC